VKNTIFWDITLCSLLKVKSSALLAAYFLVGFLLGLVFDPEDGGDVPPKRRLIFNGLHGIISQKTVLFITTDVRTSNPTDICVFTIDNFVCMCVLFS
jgi:hypothetical protein